MSILKVEHLSVNYMTGDFKGIAFKEFVMRRLEKNYSVTEFWANKDISFSIEEGDMLGIIGTNGAGKSTLLKAVSGIMKPSEGKVSRKGTIAALLELSSGFDGDLTVKENAYLRGALLGYTREFMDEMYEKILDFSELQEFENRPFKHLSSGMKSRLAFAIASLVNPDILILDEVLSVGDGAFRKKSEKKMKGIIASGATTILVSHSLTQVRSMCNKILWLHKGRQVVFGDDVQQICDDYQKFLDGELDIFDRIDNEVKSLQIRAKTELSNEPEFKKNRIHKSSIVVNDFLFGKNKIAFDMRVDERNNSLKVFMFSRNDPDSLASLAKNAISIKEHKQIIFYDSLDKKEEAIIKIKILLDDLRKTL